MPWIDLDDAKAHLNKTSSADDGELGGFIEAACAMIEDIKGHVDPLPVVETLASTPILRSHSRYGHILAWDHVVLLTETPVASVTSVAFLAGDGTSSTIAEQDLASGVSYGWRLNGTVVTVPFTTPRYGAFEITYTAGVDPVPANYRMAALELVAHLWRTTQLNASAGRPQGGDPDPEFIRGQTFAMPFRVRELLGIYGNTVGAAGVTLA